MEEVILTKENFEGEVLKSDKPVIIDFWATWCGPCMMLKPELEKLAKETDKVKICTCNVDEQGVLAVDFNIEVIPTLVLIENGEEKRRFSGYVKKDEIFSKLGL